MVNSADYLEIITRPGRYVMVEKSAFEEPSRDDVIAVKDADGNDGIKMPPAIFDEFCAKGFLRQDGEPDEGRCVVFLPTQEAYPAQNGSKQATGLFGDGRKPETSVAQSAGRLSKPTKAPCELASRRATRAMDAGLQERRIGAKIYVQRNLTSHERAEPFEQRQWTRGAPRRRHRLQMR
jgi:hypothetical protein